MHRTALYAGALLVAILGIVLRFDSVRSSLWLDEFGTLWVVEGDFMSMLRRCWEFQGQSPLYYALPWLSIQVFGESEIALRIPSLAFTCLTVGVLYLCARMLAGPRAGLYAAALFWLSVAGVQNSVQARPYALVLFTVAVAISGFVWAVHSGDRRGRTVWIVGGAAVAWAHYVHYPVVAGLFVAYGLFRSLRLRYPVRQFVSDALVQMALVSLCLPQIFALLARRGTLSWIDRWNHGVFLQPFIALSLGVLIGCSQLWFRRDTSRMQRALQVALLLCLVVQVGVLEGAALGGMNLLSTRYFVSIAIPAVLFVSVTLVRARAGETIVAILTVFAVVTGAMFVASKRTTGSLAGIPAEGWRGAVADLTMRLRDERDPLVLYRSGFVEDDRVPLGNPPPTVFAPLRSPGQPPFPVAVVPLNFRWAHPLRDAYFESDIAPRVNGRSRFYYIGAVADSSIGSYINGFTDWVESRWPGTFSVRRTGHGAVQLLEFEVRRPRD